MSENKKSFWSSIPGLVTGLAGLLTGIVGLVTVLIQLDVIGGGNDSAKPAAGVTTTVAPGTTGNAASGAVTTTISGKLSAAPSPLKLATTEREKSITVTNDATGPLTVLKPQYTGDDKTAFSTDSGCTNVSLMPGRSCTMKVQLSSSSALKVYKATLVLEAKELPRATEVPVEASTLL